MSSEKTISDTDKNEVSWTTEELDKWVKAGLIPKDLLQDQKQLELHKFILDNKDTLYKHY